MSFPQLEDAPEVGTSPVLDDNLDLTSYCARPACRQEFRQSAGRGRRRDYCSDLCRRQADRDYKRAKAMLAHFEELASRSRLDVAAFGRGNEEHPPATHGEPPELQRRALERAIARAGGVLEFASEDRDPQLLKELRALHGAVTAAFAPAP